MIRSPALAPLLFFSVSCASAPSVDAGDPHLATAYRVLATTPLFDGHNDLPITIRESPQGSVASYDLRGRIDGGHTDIPRLREGRVGAQFWSIYVPADAVDEGAARYQLEQIDIAKQIFELYPDVFAETLAAEEVVPTFRAGRIASVLGMEGGHVIENSLGALRAFYGLGARYLTLTHSRNTDWADSATDRVEHGGLSRFGEEVVREMNWLGMLVDLSHVSPATMHDALDVSEAPVIFSHSSARALIDVPRNVPDEVLRRMPENGGVVMVTFVPWFINQEAADWEATPEERRVGPAPRGTLEDVADHIDHVRQVAGVDHVGIGSDFDGIGRTPVGLEDVSKFPALFAELSRRGWSEADLRKLSGENILRAWREAEEVSRRLRRERGPSMAKIQELDG